MNRLPDSAHTPRPRRWLAATAFTVLASLSLPPGPALAGEHAPQTQPTAEAIHANFDTIRYGTETIDGLDIFYREAGTPGKPQIVLLHGFPTSSHMFRDLIPQLADDFHLIAPDYPGFGQSSAPDHTEFDYTFDNLAKLVNTLLERKGFDAYVLYIMDYGSPVGFRLATAYPERVRGFIVQNGNAYIEGMPDSFWGPIKAYWQAGKDSRAHRDALRPSFGLEVTKWQWTEGATNLAGISPDAWLHALQGLSRPGNDEAQLDLFYDYNTNVAKYPQWQAYLRQHQPPMLIAWGKNDPIFPESGAHPYLKDVPQAELHLIDTGHFVLDTHGQEVAELITRFMKNKVATQD